MRPQEGAESEEGMTLLVWHELQKIPATVYGKAHFGEGNFTIKVCKNPNREFAQLGPEKAIIYHFCGSSSGGGRV